MTNQRIERPNYFTGEALLTEDFISEQQYQIDMRRRSLAGLHTWGIVRGLEVYWRSGSQAKQVEVGAGMALDKLGREIIVLQSQVIKLDNIEPGGTYFLTLNYHEVFADYSEETGVPGYKRIVQQPQFSCVKNLKEPGLNILLAVLNFSTSGDINNLTYQFGKFERQYVGSVLGSLRFVTEGTGIEQTGGLNLFAGAVGDEDPRQPELRAKKETTSDGNYLEVDVQRTQFMGLTTTRSNLGVGLDQPVANFQLSSIRFKGEGTLSSTDRLVSLKGSVVPFFQVGDWISSDPSVSKGPQQIRRIVGTDPEHNQVTVDAAFVPALQNSPFTYWRKDLAVADSSESGRLLQIGNDGMLGFGVQANLQSGGNEPGPHALTITSDRKVGIALTDSEPRSALDVSGQITADALQVNGAITSGAITANGAVRASSFEGNGSKLKNLPILSYWTKESVGQEASKLHYNEGNVGIRYSNPPGSLSVGGGQSFIGSGLISAVTGNKLNGYQTRFTSEVSQGDTISIGNLIEQRRTVASITNDHTLTLNDQFPINLNNSIFKYQAPKQKEATGSGSITSDGTTILGDSDTKFTQELKVGDTLIIAQFDPAGGTTPQTWYVAETPTKDDELTLLPNSKDKNVADELEGTQFHANVSAFMVTPSILMYVKANAGNSVLNMNSAQAEEKTVSLPPALLVAANGANTASPNTVGINLDLADIDPEFALQVNGKVSFTGGGNIDNLTVKNLTASQSIILASDGSKNPMFTAGKAGGSPLLAVSQDNVLLGQNSGDSDYILDAKGKLHASDDIVSDATLTGASLAVSGNQINSDGSVQFFAKPSRAYTEKDMTNNGTKFQQTAGTDGFVVATVGQPDNTEYLGTLEGKTSSGVYTYATGTAYKFTTGGGKKGGDSHTYYIPLPGGFTLPVAKGDTWTLTLTHVDGFLPKPKVQFYWVPLGDTGGGNVKAAAVQPGPQIATAAPSPMEDALNQIKARISSGQLQQDILSGNQESIDQRTNDLARVIGDATGMTSDPEQRKKFLDELKNVVCKAIPPGTPENNQVEQKAIDGVIDTFARISNLKLTPEQQQLLRQGIRALTIINANDQNRNDLNLIKENINLFIDNVSEAIGKPFDRQQRRLLTRALVRIVGDGSADQSTLLNTSPDTEDNTNTDTDTDTNTDTEPDADTEKNNPPDSATAQSLLQAIDKKVQHSISDSPRLKQKLGDLLEQGKHDSASVLKTIESAIAGKPDTRGKAALIKLIENAIDKKLHGQSGAVNDFIGELEKKLNQTLSEKQKKQMANQINRTAKDNSKPEGKLENLLQGVEKIVGGALDDKIRKKVTAAARQLLERLV